MLNAGVLVLGLTFALLPVAVRNRIVGGEWHLTTSQFGSNLYIGNNPNADGTYAALREGRGTAEYERQDATELAEAASWTPPDAWRGLDLLGARDNEVCSNTAWCVVEAHGQERPRWCGTAPSSSTPRARKATKTGRHCFARLAHVGHFGVLVPLAVLGVFTTWKDRSRIGVYYAMAAAYVSSVVVFYVSARYRLPLVPFLMLFASAGLASLASFVRTAGAREDRCCRSSHRSRGDCHKPADLVGRSSCEPTTETNLGVALQTDERLEEAEAHYRRAIAIDPDYGPAYVNLGMTLVALNRPYEAIDAYRRAIELGSADVELDYKLGNASLQAGRAAEAVGYFERAIAAGQRSAQLYSNLGIALVRTNREDEAIVAYREALRINPNNSVLRFTAGSLLAKHEKFGEAIDEFRAGLALVPESPEAHNNLGGALAATGRTAEAIAEFEHALRLDPNLVSARRNLELVRPRK